MIKKIRWLRRFVLLLWNGVVMGVMEKQTLPAVWMKSLMLGIRGQYTPPVPFVCMLLHCQSENHMMETYLRDIVQRQSSQDMTDTGAICNQECSKRRSFWKVSFCSHDYSGNGDKCCTLGSSRFTRSSLSVSSCILLTIHVYSQAIVDFAVLNLFFIIVPNSFSARKTHEYSPNSYNCIICFVTRGERPLLPFFSCCDLHILW